MKLEYIFKTQDSGRPKHCFYKKQKKNKKKQKQWNREASWKSNQEKWLTTKAHRCEWEKDKSQCNHFKDEE